MNKKPSREQRKKQKERELKRLALSGAVPAATPRGASTEPEGAAREAAPRSAKKPGAHRKPERAPHHEHEEEEATSAREPVASPRAKKKDRGYIGLVMAALVGVAAFMVYLQYRPVTPPAPENEETKKASILVPKAADLAPHKLPTAPPIDDSPPTIVTAAPPPAIVASAAPSDKPVAAAPPPAKTSKPAEAAPKPAEVAPKPAAAPKAAAPAAPKKPKSDDTYN